jgi:hypothetical protein
MNTKATESHQPVSPRVRYMTILCSQHSGSTEVLPLIVPDVRALLTVMIVERHRGDAFHWETVMIERLEDQFGR